MRRVRGLAALVGGSRITSLSYSTAGWCSAAGSYWAQQSRRRQWIPLAHRQRARRGLGHCPAAARCHDLAEGLQSWISAVPRDPQGSCTAAGGGIPGSVRQRARLRGHRAQRRAGVCAPSPGSGGLVHPTRRTGSAGSRTPRQGTAPPRWLPEVSDKSPSVRSAATGKPAATRGLVATSAERTTGVAGGAGCGACGNNTSASRRGCRLDPRRPWRARLIPSRSPDRVDRRHRCCIAKEAGDAEPVLDRPQQAVVVGGL